MHHRKFTVHKSPIHGQGVFATEFIAKDEVVLRVRGPIHQLEDDESIKPEYENWVGTDFGLWTQPLDETLFLNHSCYPNTVLSGDMSIVALEDVEAGDEITFDYSLSERVVKWHMHCLCGQACCRQLISSVQSLPDYVIQRYLPDIPRFALLSYLQYRERVRDTIGPLKPKARSIRDELC